MEQKPYRVEKDSMGDVRVPRDAYYGAQTQRAVENFPISGIGFPPSFIRALATVKLAAAMVNEELGLLDPKIAGAVSRAAEEVRDGKHDKEFVVDIFQTGSGTSTNMNANEVIANRALELLGRSKGDGGIHPNDHVNMSQSSNDVVPTALHLAALETIRKELLPSLVLLHKALKKKSEEFDGIVKIGRTHLMDATPVRLGQEFGGYARQIHLSGERIEQAARGLEELALGGTAVGTGINTHREFASRAIARLSEMTGIRLREAENHFEAQAAKDAVVHVSGALKTLAVSLTKIASDVRWLASGPQCGIGEISLPEIQPGSSIMPGKINPVMCESVLQVAAHVMGSDTTITLCGQAGNFELNVMMPILALRLLEAITLTASVVRAFTEKCIIGIGVNEERCKELVEKSLALATPLATVIGYDAAAEVAKESQRSGKTVRQVARERRVLPEDQLTRVLDTRSMTEPGLAGKDFEQN